MGKIATFFKTVVLLNVLLVAGLVAFVMATGRLDKAKAQTILDMLRHPGTPAGLREQVADLMGPGVAATAPAEGAATQVGPRLRGTEGELAAVASASDRIAYAQQAMEQERLRVEREAQELRQRQNLLEQQRRQVEVKLAEISEEKKKFDAQVKAQEGRSREESFTRSLALYSELKPKQVKELFLGMGPDVVADYIKAMEQERATKIIGEFKSVEEKQFIGAVLEKIRGVGTPAATAPGSPSATMPAEAVQARS